MKPRIEIPDAFPVCMVRVFRRGRERPDWFSVTRVQEDRLNLEAERKKLDHLPPAAGERIHIQSALDDGAYRMPARVMKCRASKWVTLVCEQEGEIERIQRRITTRLFANLPVCIERLSRPADEPLNLATEDVNSHGMRVLSKTRMKLAESLKVTLDLVDGKPDLTCQASVVRCRKMGDGLFHIGIRFHGLEKAAQDRIVTVLLLRLFNL